MLFRSEMDEIREDAAGKAKIGTTRRGIGPAYEDKVGRRSIRVMDLISEKNLDHRLETVLMHHNAIRKGLGKLGLQWPVKEDGTDTQILHTEEFKLGKGRLKNFDWKESSEIEANRKDYPLILTTSRVLQHYNAATMTRRTNNINIVDEDVLLIHPKEIGRAHV